MTHPWSLALLFLLVSHSLSTSALGHGPQPFAGEASWDPHFSASAAARNLTAAAVGPSALIALSAATFRPGQSLVIGLNAQNPAGGLPADLFVGALLPDGQTLAVLSSTGALQIGTLANLSAISPTQAALPGFTLSNPGYFQFTFPTGGGFLPGTYQVFAVLLRQGALANNQIDPGEELAIDSKTFTFATGLPSGALPFLIRPFTSDYYAGSFFDHTYPREFVDATGLITPYWGEMLNFPLSQDVNHEGYDFSLPEGAPILAAAAGSVVFAGLGSPSFCPPLGAVVQTPGIEIEHVAPNGVRFRSSYGHQSRTDVSVGQQVVAGQMLGLSGKLGCAGGPHLHFEIFRIDPLTGRKITTDPYGWAGIYADPWEQQADGVKSVWLWQDGNAPLVSRGFDLAPNPSGSTAPVTLTSFRWMGVNDAQNPNNEYVEVTLDGRFATSSMRDLTGFTLRNNRGDVFAFPSGFQIQVGHPVRVYTGPGIRADTVLFWGLGAGVWDNVSDCVRLVYPTGGAYGLSNAAGACG